jgi:hydroxyacyl-ACP dehydratase HTD2-like protein with hotdog domain
VNGLSRLNQIRVGDRLPEREFKTDNVQLFLYNAVLWNAHRIHFDHPYATEVEGYPGLVNAGPLMGDWLTQCVLEWLGDDGHLKSIEYTNRKASIIGEVLRSSGKVLSTDPEANTAVLEVKISNQAGEAIAPCTATVSFNTK